MNKSVKEYIDEIFEKTGVAISSHDPVMVVMAMLEVFFTETFRQLAELFTDLKEKVSLLKMDADALDEKRRERFLADAEMLQQQFLSSFRTIANETLHDQRTESGKISSEFTRSVSSSMREASKSYENNVRYIVWFSIGNVFALLLNMYFFIRSL